MKNRQLSAARLFSALLALAPLAVHSQSQLLDPGFGTGGKVITSIGPDGDVLFALAVQGDQKIVAAGMAKVGGVNAFAVARYKTDGTLDSAFGTGGIVTTPVGAASGAAAVAIQDDGKIVVGGYTFAANLDFAVLRYTKDGALDTSFSGDGIAVAPVGAGNDVARGMALQTDGKIILVGKCNIASVLHFGMARFKADGALDGDFDGDGVLISPFTSGASDAYAVAVQGDGKIVLTGSAGNESFGLARFKDNGAVDSSFGTGGRVITDLPGTSAVGKAVAVLASKKILVAGVSQPGGNNEQFTLARYLEDGSIDSGFGTAGIVTTDFDNNNDNAASMVLQPDGKIIVAGYAFVATSFPDFALARYLENGTLDEGFGTGGKVVTDFGVGTNTVNAIALQADGKIVAGGIVNAGATSDFGLARYIPAVATRLEEVFSSRRESLFAARSIRGQLVIETPDYANATAGVFDLKGRLVQAIPLTAARTSASIGHLSRGLYFVKAAFSSGVAVRTFLKE